MTSTMLQTASLFYQAKFVDVNGIRTRYYELGQGEPLVLCHGDEWCGKGSANTWSLNLGSLAQTFHVYAPDKLGSGMTGNPKSDDQYTIQAVVQHMYDFIRIMGLKSVHLIGQSRGAGVVARLALEHPELAKTLVIVDSQTLAPEVGDYDERRRKLFGDLPKKDVREYVRQYWQRMSHNTQHVTDDYVEAGAFMEIQPKSQEAKRKMEGGLMKIWTDSLLLQKEESLRWIKKGKLQVPTLLYWGANDPTATLAQGLALFDLIREHTPRAQMHIVNHAGHFHYREYPEEWSRVVTNFIQSS